jgi:uncharacterized protein YjbJ (UPF0337 family)
MSATNYSASIRELGNTRCSVFGDYSMDSAKEDSMGLPNRDEVEGKLDQAKGSVKETVGRVTNDRDLEAEGNADRTGGKVQEGFGTARRKVGETIEDIGESIRK